MDRQEKLMFLKGVLSGKSIGELLPKIEVCFMERQAGKYIVSVDGRYKYIQVCEAEAFTQKVRLENPLKIVEVSKIDHAEYLLMKEQLENEY